MVLLHFSPLTLIDFSTHSKSSEILLFLLYTILLKIKTLFFVELLFITFIVSVVNKLIKFGSISSPVIFTSLFVEIFCKWNINFEPELNLKAFFILK